MPDVWLPGCTIDLGINAGYRGGRNSLQLAVAHYTVGSDSRGIAKRGYFHWLVHQDESREGGCTQYAEIDAVTWHAGGSSGMPDANQRGPGTEFERMVTGPPGPDGISEAEPLTPNQIYWAQRIVEFCAEWGIPTELYDGPRYGGRDWHGWINHHDLDKDRSDGLTNAEWNLIISSGGNAPETKKKGRKKMYVTGNVIDSGPDSGKVLEVLFDTTSGVECGRMVEDGGPYGFGPVGSAWIDHGAVAFFTSGLSAYVIHERMAALRRANGYDDPFD